MNRKEYLLKIADIIDMIDEFVSTQNRYKRYKDIIKFSTTYHEREKDFPYISFYTAEEAINTFKNGLYSSTIFHVLATAPKNYEYTLNFMMSEDSIKKIKNLTIEMNKQIDKINNNKVKYIKQYFGINDMNLKDKLIKENDDSVIIAKKDEDVLKLSTYTLDYFDNEFTFFKHDNDIKFNNIPSSWKDIIEIAKEIGGEYYI